MGKSFNKIVSVAKTKTYGEVENALVVSAASKAKGLKFVPLSPGGYNNNTAKYVIKVPKRVKSKTVGKNGDVVISTDNVSDMTVADNFKIYDSMDTADWDESEFATGVLRTIGVKTGLNDKLEIDDLGSVQEESINSQVGNQAITRKEVLIKEIVNFAENGKGVYSPITMEELSPTDLIWDIVSEGSSEVQKASDDYKHRTPSSEIIVFMDTELKNKTAKELGTAFLNEAPIYGTGLKTKYSVNGYAVIEVPELDQFLVDTDKNVKMIVMAADTYFQYTDGLEEMLDDKIGLNKYLGKVFYDVTGVIPQLANKRVKLYHSADADKIAETESVND